MARTPHTVRGFQRNLTIPSSTPKFQGPNFGVTGWTVTRGRLWWQWQREWLVVNSSSVPFWAGTMAWGLFETGTVIPGPESSPNAEWVHWQPITSLDDHNLGVWYDQGTPASTVFPINAGYFEWKTQRTAPGAGMDLWWCWDFPSSFGPSDRVSWAWVIQYESL